jgi:peptide chain release factor 1
VQSSSLTVVVLEVPTEQEVFIDPRDCEWQFARGSGAGGQHRNKTDSACRLTHKPTGIVVWCESERSQHQNKQTALSVLRSRIKNAEQERRHEERARERRQQAGTGMRGDKRRTIRLQADEVTDHVLGVRMTAKDYMRGKLDPLYA